MSTLAWVGKVKSPFQRSLPLLLIATLHVGSFTVAGLFSSQITDTRAGLALVRSEKCGFPVELPKPGSVESAELTGEELLTFNTEVLLGRLTLTKSASYVRTCYNDDVNSGTATCNLYVKPHLVGSNATADNDAPCPFGNDACVTRAVRYDSGHIYSNRDLGINTPDFDSLSVRRVTSCAPILGEEKYSTGWRQNVSEAFVGKTNTSVKYFEFGKGENGCEATNETTNLTTFCVSEYQKENVQNAYTVRTNNFYYNNKTASDFEPIQDFAVPNADVTLAAILNKALYAGNSTDPLFKALNQSEKNPTFYTASNDLSFLGCTEQYQFCNGASGRCTDLTGLYAIKHSIENGDLALTPRQNAVYQILWKSAWASAIRWAFQVLGPNLLLAQDWVFTVNSQTSSALPPYQWELESFNLHNLSLAVFQRRVNEYASPEIFEIRPGLSSLDQIIRPTDPDMLALCDQQKVKSVAHYSINVLGMAIILIVGSLLILLDWILIQQIFWFRTITHKKLAKKTCWQNDGTLMLYQQALESRGIGPWDTKNYMFPTLASEKRNLMFSPLGAQLEVSVPFQQDQWQYGHGQDTAYNGYNGGKYSPLSNQISRPSIEIHAVQGDDKATREQ
ncbi:hypothetical protein CC78DRAFT_549314 [Lojkania enalia]|uniref:Uncharacterized protein n=1 Tax=Lojkania enalia TaxID=147567 RepID=A0A9P4K2A6_9PLEO|nr:hypothetical protein CC78DRAFT_549314 [Didymosphaeria enalia]